jgi:serine/threonine protein kinase
MNQYRILERLSSGSFGTVFKIVRVTDGKILVMKRIPMENLDDHARAAATMEVELMKQLNHPCIVSHRDAFLFNHTDMCIVMDFYEGGDLAAAIHRAAESNRPFSEQQIMLWFVQMSLALHYLHSHRIVHRDLKTHNVFLDAATGQVAVGDFGVAKILDSGGSSHPVDATKKTTGTPLYMAPEVLQGNPGTFKSDMWSLGCVLY